jgi:hypothetical protein
MTDEAKSRGIRTTPTVPRPTRSARQPGANSQRHVIVAAIGLAALAHRAHESRSTQHVIMGVIGLAAVAGLARASQARSFARLAAWDKRQALGAQRVPRTRRA